MSPAPKQTELEIYSRLHTAFAMSYGEVCQLKAALQSCSSLLHEEADKIDAILANPVSSAQGWYEVISKERDALTKLKNDTVNK